MRRAFVLAALIGAAWSSAPAQVWQSGTGIDLIRRAVAHRVARDADTLVTSWQADAHGIVRSASVLDQGDGPVERVIKLDELQVEVYGESPNRSKQIVVAWRDTSFLPNRISYHRDHLGIVANDFGATIRLGQGEEVRDVVHPLSEAGLAMYQFALGDTVQLRGPAGRVRVVAVQVRPANPDSAGAVGTLFLDIERAALVRFQFTFTRTSYRDGTVEGITVTLENALLAGAKWLPWRQSIVIRRGETIVDLPIRTVIRGDWSIDNYRLGVVQAPGRFAGPFIVVPRGPIAGGKWPGPISATGVTLPGADAGVAEIERDASAALGGRLLDALPRMRFLAGGISDLIHVNRVEGVTPAIGVRLAIGAADVLRLRAGIGLSDQRAIGGAEWDRFITGSVMLLPVKQLRFFVDRRARDIADTPLISGVLNSLSTLVGDTDFGDYALVDRAGIGATLGFPGSHLDVDWEWQRLTTLGVTFRSLNGSKQFNPALGNREDVITEIRYTQRDPAGRGFTADYQRAGLGDWSRLALHAMGTHGAVGGLLRLSADAGLLWGDDPPVFRSFAIGGPGTLPGVPFREFGGLRMLLADLSLAFPVAFPAPHFPYSRYINLPTTIAPFIAAGIVGGDLPSAPWRANSRVEPVAGLRLDLWGPLFRMESGVSLRTGHIGVTFDVHPNWWWLM